MGSSAHRGEQQVAQVIRPEYNQKRALVRKVFCFNSKLFCVALFYKRSLFASHAAHMMVCTQIHCKAVFFSAHVTDASVTCFIIAEARVRKLCSSNFKQRSAPLVRICRSSFAAQHCLLGTEKQIPVPAAS